MIGLRHCLTSTIAGCAVAALVACAEVATPVAPPATDPALTANTEGPLAVERVVGLEPLLGAPVHATTIANGINDLGLVVGSSTAPDGQRHAVLWNPSVSPFPQDLGTLSGGISSGASAVNSAGTVIVGSARMANLDDHAVRWVYVNGVWTIQDLGPLPSTTAAGAWDIADDGSIVGSSGTGSNTRGFLWRNGVITDLGAAGVSLPNALNGNGQVVGGNAVSHAVLWTESGGAMEIGTLGGSFSLAHDINESGEVVGSSATSSSDFRAFLWTPRKGMVALATLGGFASASAINRAGYIVGESFTTANQRRAVLWAKGKILDLGVLPGYVDAVARDINNEKQVVGFSEASAVRATLWTIK